ncbi:MAG: hypothetical protein KBS59_04785 [Clostridiales bacterium]|nr:hypothetical protein [Clostridiales bacterium]
MIRLFVYELKKLYRNKLLVILLLLLIAVNVWLTLGQITDEKIVSEHNLSSFIEIYKADPDGMDEYISNYLSAYEAAARSKMPRSGMDPIPYPESQYTENDRVFFNGDFNNVKNLTKAYQKTLKNAKRAALGHISEYEYLGFGENSFEWKYQQTLLDSYEPLNALEFPMENVIGYDVFFDYSGFSALLLVALTLCGIMLVIPDKSGGMVLILRASKNGRAKTYLSKILVGLLSTLVLTAVFAASTMIAIYLKLGFYGGFLPLQMVDTMRFTPYIITIWGGIFYVLCARLFSGFAFLCVVMTVACFFSDYILPFGISALFIGFNYALGTYNFLNAYSAMKNLNFFWSIDGTKYISVWQGIKVFGRCRSLLPSLIVVYSAIIIVCGVLGAYLFARGTLGKGKKISLDLGFLKKLEKIRIPYGISLPRYEIRKILTPIAAIIVVLILLLDMYLSNASFNLEHSYAQGVYSEYMTELDGEWTEEKHAYIENEYRTLNEIVSKEEYMRTGFQTGAISSSEYFEYMSNLLSAQVKVGVASKIYSHSQYLKELHDGGIPVAFFDDTGWRFMRTVNISYILCAALILIFADVFSYEHRSGFIFIQRSEKHGRGHVVLTKFVIVAVFALVIGLAFEMIQFLYAGKFQGLYGLDYPAASLEGVKAKSASVLGYFVLTVVRNILMCSAIAVGTAGISKLTKKILPALIVPTVVIFAPSVLAYFGVELFKKISILNLFAR